MTSPRTIDRVLAVAGAVLVLSPLALTVLLSLIASLGAARVLFDFLLPAELFPLFLAGALLTTVAALRTRSHRYWVIGGALVTALALLSAQGAAIATGLAAGDRAPQGWPFALVMGLFLLFLAAMVATGVGSVALARYVLRARSPSRPRVRSGPG
jgi:hypothetical protein